MKKDELVKELYDMSDKYSGRISDLLLLAAAEILRPSPDTKCVIND